MDVLINHLENCPNEFLKVKLNNRSDFIYGRIVSVGLFQMSRATPFNPTFPIGFHVFDLSKSKEQFIDFIRIYENEIEAIDVVRDGCY